MKNKMPARKLVGKVSTFLTSLKRKNNHSSLTRRLQRNPDQLPKSTKVGAGEITARRNLPNQILHKRNHRSNEIVQG